MKLTVVEAVPLVGLDVAPEFADIASDLLLNDTTEVYPDVGPTKLVNSSWAVDAIFAFPGKLVVLTFPMTAPSSYV